MRVEDAKRVGSSRSVWRVHSHRTVSRVSTVVIKSEAEKLRSTVGRDSRRGLWLCPTLASALASILWR